MTIKTLTVRLDEELHQRFKIYAVNAKKDMQEILREHIKELVEHDENAE